MGKYIAKKGKVCRRFGVNLFGNIKYDAILQKRPNGPGVHGVVAGRKKVSEYGRQLIEKQKLKIMYGLREKQFKNTFQKAMKQEGVTGDNLLKLLELRLDNVIYRLGWAESRLAARQLVNHGHVKVNGRRVNVPSYQVKSGEEITVKDSDRSKSLIKRNIERSSRRDVVEWLDVVNEDLKAKIVREPVREETPTIADEQMVVELYSK